MMVALSGVRRTRVGEYDVTEAKMLDAIMEVPK